MLILLAQTNTSQEIGWALIAVAVVFSVVFINLLRISWVWGIFVFPIVFLACVSISYIVVETLNFFCLVLLMVVFLVVMYFRRRKKEAADRERKESG